MLKRLLVTVLVVLSGAAADAENKIIQNKTIRNATVAAGDRLTVRQGGKTFNTVIGNGGIEDVFWGAVSQNAAVQKGGKLWLAGGISYGAVVHEGGLMEVREHNGKRSYAANVTLLPGGNMNVFNRSLAEKITVQNNCLLRVFFTKAVISDVKILSGGVVHVWKRGTAQNVYVAPGGVLDLREDSPVLKGRITIAGQLRASFDHKPDVSKAQIVLDLTRRHATDAPAIINLDYLGKANIAVNISGTQADGVYKLASWAGIWNDPLTLVIDGKKTISLLPGSGEIYNGKYYLISKNTGNCLVLHIGDEKRIKNITAAENENELPVLKWKWKPPFAVVADRNFRADTGKWQSPPDPRWHKSLDSAFLAAKKKKKKIFLWQTGSQWCGPCKRMYQELFQNPENKKIIEKHFEIAYFDIPFKYESRVQELYHELIFNTLNLSGGVPHVLIIGTDGKVYGNFLGFGKAERYMDRLIRSSSGKPIGKTLPSWIVRSPENLEEKIAGLHDTKAKNADKAAMVMEQVTANARLQIVSWGLDPDNPDCKFDPSNPIVLPVDTKVYFLVRYELPSDEKVSISLSSSRTISSYRNEKNNGKELIHCMYARFPGHTGSITVTLRLAMPESPTASTAIPCNIVWEK